MAPEEVEYEPGSPLFMNGSTLNPQHKIANGTVSLTSIRFLNYILYSKQFIYTAQSSWRSWME